MATLQRFKFLATQCATAAVRSPATSPSASPSPHLVAAAAAAAAASAAGAAPNTTPSKSPSFNLRHHRRRRTLRRLLSGSSTRSSSASNSSSSTSSTSSAGGGSRSIFTKAAKGRSSLDLAAPKAPAPEGDGGERRGLLSHRSLKDLFVSSPSPPPSSKGASNARGGGAEEASGGGDWLRIRSPVRGGRGGWRLGMADGLSSRRFGASGGSLRYRLLRRAWRPVLVTIPE